MVAAPSVFNQRVLQPADNLVSGGDPLRIGQDSQLRGQVGQEFVRLQLRKHHVHKRREGLIQLPVQRVDQQRLAHARAAGQQGRPAPALDGIRAV